MATDVNKILKLLNSYRSYKLPILRKWRLVRSLYNGDFWDVFKKKVKDYTLTPDWNYIDYATQAYNNSIYSGAFIGTVTPVDANDEEYVQSLNAFIEYQWNNWGMKNKFLHVGENGELYNLGAVRVNWNEHDHSISLESLSPDELYFDPSVDDFRKGHAVFIERSINIDTLSSDPRFEKKVKSYLAKHTRIADKTSPNKIVLNANRPAEENRTVSLIECFIRNEENKIDQIFILDEEEIIYEETLSISRFPIAVYTPNRPDGNPYGSSRFNKILNTVITLNMLDSMEATQPYRVLNRVRFTNVDGRINMRSFAEYGNTPGASFEVKGNPNDIVSFVNVPTIPDLSPLKARLENSIFQITGVDPYYKGRMTNSIQTTGATNAFQARVTMLTDNSRITLLEEFCEDLTRLVIEFYTLFSKDYSYSIPQYSTIVPDKITETKSLVFKDTKFRYKINASVLLPMNQANLFESAKALYEMQGQYGFKTPVITEQDLIRYSDFPQKDLILQRIHQENQRNTAQDLVTDLTNFASIFSRLLSQGLTEEQAAEQAINILLEEKNAIAQNPKIGAGL